jgi:hypothetical protein
MAQHHHSDAVEFVPARPEAVMTEMEDVEKAKPSTEHVENASTAEKKAINDVEHEYQDGDDAKPRVGWRKIFRSNPSMDFMREVAEANTQPLDPVEVKKVN